MYYTSGLPASADYDVQMDVFPRALTAGHYMGVMGRLTTTSPDNYYSVEYNVTNARWELWKAAGAGPTFTLLGSFSQTLSLSTTYVVKLQMRGTALTAFVDGVSRISATDSAVTATGRAGIDGLGAVAVGNAINIDNFSALDPVAAGSDIPVPLRGFIYSTLVRM